MGTLKEMMIEKIAMAIVNHTAETMGVSVDIRQKYNDCCFDYAEIKIKEAFELEED